MRMRRLPARVEAVITRQQHESEMLVGFAQLTIVALLALFYAFAPAGYSPDAPVKAAPLGLSLFAILVLLRLYFALTKQLNTWLIGAFTVAEMAVLIGTIWAYHLQFEHPPIIVFKNTAFLYVFILIALRALRFDPAWVILSGITAAAGWAILVCCALMPARGNPLTWDYVTYATTGKVHLGAELDKVLAIVMATGVLALSLTRSRRILEQSATQTQAASDLSRFFDDDVARRITQADSTAVAGQGMLRQAAILFVDLRGFTKATARLEPSQLIALLGEYQRLIVPIIQKHGGAIDKFMGDGILASFGAVTPSATYAADGIRAVDAILAAASKWQSRRAEDGLIAPGIGAGLAAGEVVFGIIGDKKRLEYTVIGDAVNLAAKLEKHNKLEVTLALAPLKALTLARAQGYEGADKETRSQRNVGGVEEPVDLAVWL